MKRLQEMVDLHEKVHTIKNPDIKPRGAPEEKARAFDKVNPKTGSRPNRSVLKKLAKERQEDEYIAVEFSDEGEYVMCLVVKNDDNMMSQAYYGINVLFYPGGKIEGVAGDSLADKQWAKDKGKIIKAAKKGLKDETLSGPYDGLSGAEVKRGKGKLSVDIDECILTDMRRRRLEEAKKRSAPFGVKIGGVSAERPEFGFEDRLNAQKAESALKDAGIEFKRHSNFGVFYFDFADEATLKKAVKIAKKVIDASEESEW